MKYLLYKDLNTPVYYINEQFEFFYYLDKTKVSDEKHDWLVQHIGDRSLPEYKCINLKTGEITNSRLLYEKSIKVSLQDPKTKILIDDLRSRGLNEATIADEIGVSVRSIQRHYRRKLNFIDPNKPEKTF